MRKIRYSKYPRAHAQPEDLGQRVAVLGAVTDSGKEILHIEEQMGHYVLDLLDTVQVQIRFKKFRNTPKLANTIARWRRWPRWHKCWA
jgi:hypothetical protein